MAYADDEEYHLAANGLYIKMPTIDADAEESAVFDACETILGGYPIAASLIVQRTAGSTNAIDVALQGSMDENTWTDLITVTAKDTEGFWPTQDYTGATEYPIQVYRFFKILCTTVGTGNTLDAHVNLLRNTTFKA